MNAPMNTATIVAKYVNPPGPGKKRGTVKLPDDDFYLVPPAMLGLFKAGGTYEVQYTTSEFNGMPYKTVASVKEKAAAPTAANSTTSPTNYIKDEFILACGALNASIRSGKIEPNEESMTRIINDARRSWLKTFGAKKTPEQKAKEDEFNDGIPF